MAKRITVDAEIDLAWDVDAVDLAEALIESIGPERARRMIASAKQNTKGRFVCNETDEVIDLIAAMREAFAEIDAGRLDAGMRALRLLCAEEVDVSKWESIKDGKHPFLILPSAASSDPPQAKQ